MSGTKESKKVKIILIYLKSDVGSTKKYGGYEQYELSLVYTSLLSLF
jgi:hypothetical protein